MGRIRMIGISRNRAARDAENSLQEMQSRLLQPNSSFAAVEAYKAARTNLLFSKAGDGCRTIAFTSSFSSEGKTLTCANLAKTIAQNGQKVLLIDADMRRPMVSHLFQTPKGYGLSEYLAGIATFGQDGETPGSLLIEKESNFYILPSGQIPPNSAELLASQRMEVLLGELSALFDYVLIDTPPVLVVTDALVLSKMISGYVLLVQAGNTPLKELQTTVQRLERVGANILGFILNDANARGGTYKRHYDSAHSAGRYAGYAYKDGR